MSDLYNETAERLWEKLEYHKDKFNIWCIDRGKPFPADQFQEKNPSFSDLIKEVQKEFNYGMSEFQCSWAVMQLIKQTDNKFKKYNKKNDTNLKSRK